MKIPKHLITSCPSSLDTNQAVINTLEPCIPVNKKLAPPFTEALEKYSSWRDDFFKHWSRLNHIEGGKKE